MRCGRFMQGHLVSDDRSDDSVLSPAATAVRASAASCVVAYQRAVPWMMASLSMVSRGVKSRLPRLPTMTIRP